MRIKSDFITNSSSSAFVVAFPTKITHFDDVRDHIFPEWKAEIVLRDAKTQKPFLIKTDDETVIKKIVEALRTGYLDYLDDDNEEFGTGYFGYENKFLKREGITQDDLRKNWAWYEVLDREREYFRTKKATVVAKEFIEKNNGRYLYQFEYGDEDGEKMSEMEHGGTFNRLPHITISHH